MIIGTSQAFALHCKSIDVDAKIQKYVEFACKKVNKDMNNIVNDTIFRINKTPDTMPIIQKSFVVLDGENGYISVFFDFKAYNYKFRESDYGTAYWGVFINEFIVLGKIARSFKGAVATMAIAAKDDRANALARLPNAVILFDQKTGDALIIPVENGLIRGKTVFYHMDREYTVGGVDSSGSTFYFDGKLRNTSLQGVTTLTPSGMVAKFLGVKF